MEVAEVHICWILSLKAKCYALCNPLTFHPEQVKKKKKKDALTNKKNVTGAYVSLAPPISKFQ